MTSPPRYSAASIPRALLLVALLLAAPIVPFILAGERIEAWVSQWLTPALSPELAAVVVVGVLATDVFLPVPSSLVSTWAGARLGLAAGTLAVWCGMMAGSVLGFAAARYGGRPLVERWIGREDLARLDTLAERQAWWLLILTRPLPVLAEAAVLLVGALRLNWRDFWLATAPVSLALAAAYAALGRVAQHESWTAAALALSVAAPLAATWAARRALSRSYAALHPHN